VVGETLTMQPRRGHRLTCFFESAGVVKTDDFKATIAPIVFVSTLRNAQSWC
jgi:hypothetical protein